MSYSNSSSASDIPFDPYLDVDPPQRRRPFRCSDGFCGADDCARCNPTTFDQDEEESDD